ncbi:MAG TPA: enoyl-CoA hydratase-related protein [Candidatus Limnocylindrales bacterium]
MTDPLREDRVPLDDGGAIIVLTLDRRDVMNAIDNAMLAALHAALDVVEADAGVRGVVFAGAGERAFCSGMDLKERAGFGDDELRAQRALIVGLIRRVHELAVPSIAAVDGVALGGGFELALACDLIVAGTGASFGLPEVKVGIFPGGGSTQTLTWLVGPARTRDVILTGRRLSAPEAEAWGVVARVVEAGRARDEAVALAASIAEGAPLGVRQAKAAIRGAHRALADGLEAENALYEIVLVSDDRREGFRAFTERRKPRFTGR